MLPAKKRIIRNLAVVAGAALVMLVGCDRASRHKVLTFFFEGVPPLDADREKPESETVLEEKAPVDVVEEESIRAIKQTDASTHEPSKECGQCHSQQGGWNRNRLVRSMPDLCYSCHSSYARQSGYLHGPVAVGACSFCHDPHQSKYVKLQKAPQPDLCYRCHDQEGIESIADHPDQQHRICTQCHDPHTGAGRYFLKPAPEPKDTPAAADLSE